MPTNPGRGGTYLQVMLDHGPLIKPLLTLLTFQTRLVIYLYNQLRTGDMHQ